MRMSSSKEFRLWRPFPEHAVLAESVVSVDRNIDGIIIWYWPSTSAVIKRHSDVDVTSGNVGVVAIFLIMFNILF